MSKPRITPAPTITTVYTFKNAAELTTFLTTTIKKFTNVISFTVNGSKPVSNAGRRSPGSTISGQVTLSNAVTNGPIRDYVYPVTGTLIRSTVPIAPARGTSGTRVVFISGGKVTLSAII